MLRPFQLDLVNEPFWLLVGCIIGDRTSWTRTAPYFAYVRNRVKNDPAILAEIQYGRENGSAEAAAAYTALERTLGPLGLASTRAHAICKLAVAWTERREGNRLPETYLDVQALPGCGDYAAEAWRIFVDGDLDFEPEDKSLSEYVAQTRREASPAEAGGEEKAQGAPTPAKKKKSRSTGS